MANIEYSAIISYVDTMMMTASGITSQYYSDIVDVIDDECRHLIALHQILDDSGWGFPSLPVNNNILRDLERTRDCLKDRIAMISLVHEAKGLDAGHRLIEKAKKVGCRRTQEVVEMIIKEERQHVRFGVKWFSRLCLEEGKDPKSEYIQFLKRRNVTLYPQSMDFDARNEANFPRDWIPTS